MKYLVNVNKIREFSLLSKVYFNNFWYFLFNKCRILSLFSGNVLPTFVSSTNKDRFHLPMTQYTTYYLHASNSFLRLGKMLLLAGLVLLCTRTFAQGWEIYFGGNFEDWGNSIIQTKNQDYIIAGFTEGFGVNNTAVYAVRTDVDGRKIWERTFDEGHISRGYSILETDDEAFLIVGEIINVPQDFQKNVYLLKIDNRGELLWSNQYGGADNDIGWRVIPSATDNGYLIVGSTRSSGNGGNDIFVVKVDENGTEQWSHTYGTVGDDQGKGIVATNDGYLITGSAFNPASTFADIYLLKIDFNGNVVWADKFFGSPAFDEGQNIIATADGNFAIIATSDSRAFLLKVDPAGNKIWSKTFNTTLGAEAYDLIETPNGDLIFTGFVEIDATNADAFLARFDTNGNELWRNIIGRGSHFDSGQSLIQTADKGFAVTGYNSLFGVLFNDVTFIKTDQNGSVYTNHLSGKVFIDENNDCGYNVGEEGLHEWIVSARSADQTFFGTSDGEGNYDITIDTGEYSVTVYVKNEYWASCVAAYNVSFNTQYDTLTRNFPILKSTLCPLLEVDVSAPVAQNCSNIGYSVDYCNYGTQGVANPIIEIILDENLTLTGADLPFTVDDSLYVFELDPLGIDECGSFYFSAESSCNGVPFEAYTVSAHIYPDSICFPVSGWDMSDIKVNGYCDADSVRFEIENKGNGNMANPLEFIVIEDQVLAREGSYNLTAGQQFKTAVESNGKTYRLIAQQAPGHPGNSYPTIAIEGCTTGGSISTGHVTELQEDENDPFVSVDVQEAISPTDYIFMRGYPKGYLKDGDYLIPANTPLQYHIYFQNLGTDTIQHLTIRDTLPESLELVSVVPGASSHPYQFEAYSNGVLRFTFENLNLSPGSDTASIGFVQFKVSQKPNNPDGTVIPNSAAVFLGYDAPGQTATVTHVVDTSEVREMILTDVSEPFVPDLKVNAYPNPFTSSIVFEIKDYQDRFKLLTLTVFDMSGRMVRQEKASGSQLQLTRGNLLAGLYSFRLEGDGLLLNTGKIIVR